jgi:uncharacterized protein with PQ loop repeat
MPRAAARAHCHPFKSKYSDWNKKVSGYFPKLNINHDFCQLYANFMFIVAIIAVVPAIIQLSKVIKTKDVEGISLWAYIFSAVITLLWLIYAILCGNGIIIISRAIALVVGVILVILIVKYAKA